MTNNENTMNGEVVNLSTVKDGENTYEIPEVNYDDFKPVFNFDNMSDEEICVGACNKLLQDTYFGINGLPLLACFLWAYNKAKADTEFAKLVCIKSKNFTKAFDYLRKVFRENDRQGADHREIFSVLEDYFALDDYEIAKREAEAKAKKEAERKAKEAERKAKTKKPANKAEKAEKNNASKPETDNSISLFDVVGGENSATK